MESEEDFKLLSFIKRANLDAIWSRSSGTVVGNCGQVKRLMKYSFVDIFPPCGPFPLSDSFGMGLAVAILLSLLDPGRNDEHVQFSTTRKIHYALSNLWNALVHTSKAGIMSDGTKTMRVTDCPTCLFRYQQFMRGYYEQVL